MIARKSDIMSIKRYSLIVFDIDGVLTDGCIYIDENGNETKKYRLTEIDALNDIKRAGYKIAAITGEDTLIVDKFRRIVDWDFFESGCKNKLNVIKEIENELNISNEEICYIGDGKYDIEPIKYVGLGVSPQNAIQDVKDVADVVLNGCGGESCVYELYKLISEETSYE